MKCIKNTITRRRIWRISAYSAAALLLISLFPQIPAQASGTPTTIRVAMVISETMPLHPLRIMDRDAISILGLVYESLVVLDDDRRPTPKLATWSNPSDDGSLWDFHIKPNIFFHDGRELRASDVAATMDYIRMLSQDENIPVREKGLYTLLTDSCASWEATDEYTLRVRAKTPSYQLLYAMTFPVLQAQSLYSENPPGTGPYRVDYYVPGAELSIVVNANWRERPPYISEVLGKWYPSDAAALAAFEAEQVDIMMTRSPSAVRYRGTSSSRINTYEYSTRQIEVLLFNLINTRKGLNEPLMREAICRSIDKTRLIQNAYQNTVTETNTLQSRASWLYNRGNEVRAFPYSPEEAKTILDQLGWGLINTENGVRYRKSESGDRELTIRLGFYDEAGISMRREAANEIANMLSAVGFKVEINIYDFDRAHQKLTAQDYDLFLCAFNFDIVPDPSFLLTSAGAMNFNRYNDKDMRDLCSELKRAHLPGLYQSIWADIQYKMAIDLPMLPL
ncbi:MAG: ABC transporter substrate-binding protein, partial [Clostridia bacterium]|nr:ABC transporter substrate-binding protein [Clostridia bacterium]